MPFLFKDSVYRWLEVALDSGILEERFWNMTLAEINREIESRSRVYRQQAKEKATFDYILSDLIGRSVARVHSKKNKMPSISEVYPSLFVKEEIEEQQQAKRDELTVMRFRQFAEAHNKKFKRGKQINNE